MFWNRVRHSHRYKIALVSAAVTGIVLAILFFVLVSLARDNLYGQKRASLASALHSFTPDEDTRFDLREFQEAYPELSASVYDGNGQLVDSAGRVRPGRLEGYSISGESLQLGSPFKGQFISIAIDLTDTNRGLTQLRTILMFIWLPIVSLVGGATWIAAVSVFRPLERLSAQALAMSGSNLSERLVTEDRAEFGAFAKDLNLLLDRVEETVRRGDRFSTDAAHELRTPLAIMRTRLETALLQPRTPEQYETTIRRSVVEIGRLSSITEALLRSARGEVVPATSVELQALVGEAQDRWIERFEARDVQLEAVAVSAFATILPDEVSVVVDNLLDNALRYAPPGSAVRLELSSDEHDVQLLVHDDGPGVPSELGERIFNRFVRGDDSRNRNSGGSGVGLAVCSQIVAGRGGRMILVSGHSGGASIGFRLPHVRAVGEGTTDFAVQTAL